LAKIIHITVVLFGANVEPGDPKAWMDDREEAYQRFLEGEFRV